MFATRDDDTIVRLHEVGVELPRPTTLRTLGRRAEMLPALRDLSLAVRCGQTLGIVGEHGSGKSTLAEVLLGWWRPTSGTVTFDGRDGSVELSSLQGASCGQRAAAPGGRQVPLIGAVDDRREGPHPPRVARRSTDALATLVVGVLQHVGFTSADILSARLGDLSPLERYRVKIARPLSLNPELLVVDDPGTELSNSEREDLAGMLFDLTNRLQLATVFITCSAEETRFLDRVAVLCLGTIVEVGPPEEVFGNPRHPYTRALLGHAGGAATTTEPIAPGTDPARPAGCTFHQRCPLVQDRCRTGVIAPSCFGAVSVKCVLQSEAAE